MSGRFTRELTVVGWREDDGTRELHIAPDTAEAVQAECGEALPYWSVPHRGRDLDSPDVCAGCQREAGPDGKEGAGRA